MTKEQEYQKKEATELVRMFENSVEGDENKYVALQCLNYTINKINGFEATQDLLVHLKGVKEQLIKL